MASFQALPTRIASNWVSIRLLRQERYQTAMDILEKKVVQEQSCLQDMQHSNSKRRIHKLLHVLDTANHLDMFEEILFHWHTSNTFHSPCREGSDEVLREDILQQEELIVQRLCKASQEKSKTMQGMYSSKQFVTWIEKSSADYASYCQGK